MSYCSILETKVGNDNLVNPEFMVLNQGYNCHLEKDYEKQKSLSVEMGHSRNFKSWNCNIKEMRASYNF